VTAQGEQLSQLGHDNWLKLGLESKYFRTNFQSWSDIMRDFYIFLISGYVYPRIE